MQIAHERTPDGFKDIYDVVSKDELESFGDMYKKLAGLQLEEVNLNAKKSEGTAERLGLKPPKAWVA